MPVLNAILPAFTGRPVTRHPRRASARLLLVGGLAALAPFLAPPDLARVMARSAPPARAQFLKQAGAHVIVPVDLFAHPTSGQVLARLTPGDEIAVGGRLHVAVGLAARELYWVRAQTAGQVHYGFAPATALRADGSGIAALDLAAVPAGGWARPETSSAIGGRAALPAEPGTSAPIASRGESGPAAWMPPSVRRWWPQIERAARVEGLDPQLVAIVVLVESGGDPGAGSPVGARGLMQLMPATALEVAGQMGIRGMGADELWQPEVNLALGARYLAEQVARFGGGDASQGTIELAAAAYNGGPGRALAYRSAGRALPAETRSYVAWVGGMWRERADAASPSFEAWMAAGGRRLVQAAGAAMPGG